MTMSSSGVMLSVAPHHEGRVSKDGAASCFETPHFVRLLSMRPRKRVIKVGCLMLRDAALRAAPQHEAEETSSLGPLAYHDVYRVPVGGCDRRRFASRRSEPKSPRISASFFA